MGDSIGRLVVHFSNEKPHQMTGGVEHVTNTSCRAFWGKPCVKQNIWKLPNKPSGMPNTPNKSGIQVLGWELYWTQTCARLLSCSNYTWKCLLAGNYCNSSPKEESLPKHIGNLALFLQWNLVILSKVTINTNRCFSKFRYQTVGIYKHQSFCTISVLCFPIWKNHIFDSMSILSGKETGQIVRIWPYYCLEAWKTNTPVFGLQALVLGGCITYLGLVDFKLWCWYNPNNLYQLLRII